MFGMFPFMFNNNNSNFLSNNNSNFLSNNNDMYNMLINGQLTNIMDQMLSSDFINNVVNEMLEEDYYDINFKDCGDYYLIKGHLPGISARDINIDFENNKAILTIKNKHVYSNNNNTMVAIIQSRDDYVKTFYVEEIDVTKLRASFVNDNLSLTLPKLKRIYKEEEQIIVDVDNYKIE